MAVEGEGLESHAADSGAGIVKAHSLVLESAEGTVGVAEVTIVEILPPGRQDMVQVVGDALHRATGWEIELVEALGQAHGIRAVVEGPAHCAAWSVTTPGVPVSPERCAVHEAIGAVAMEEEIAPDVQALFVAVEVVVLVCQGGEPLPKSSQAVMVSH